MSSLDTLCIELTLSCPLRCVHCSAFAGPERTESLSAAVLLRQLDQLSGLSEIYLSGGEPFEHSALPEVVRAAQTAAHRVVAYSSGTHRTSAGLVPLDQKLLGATRTAGLDRVDLSIYAADAGAHDAITRTPGSFEATVASARRVQEAGLALGIHFVPLVRSENAMYEVLGLAQNLGASRFHVLALASQGRARSCSAEQAPASLFQQMLRVLPTASALEVVFSSDIRRLMGVAVETPRDRLRAGFLDVNGYLYGSEGDRTMRSRRSLRDGASIDQLAADLRPNSLPVIA